MSSLLHIGKYTVQFVNHGFVWLDGGAMFGSIPKALWEKKIKPDEKNRIKLATRSLLIKDTERSILVDAGCGDKWSEKERNIFNFENFSQKDKPYENSEITDVILTHLHFDHAGGITHLNRENIPTLTFPKARYYLQKSNLELGLNPNIRERASYLKSHISPLKEDGDLKLISGTTELFPDIWVHEVNGHTVGQQYLEIRSEKDTYLYPTDLIPTSHHLPLPYHMGYDMCAKTVLEEKERFLNYALEKNAIVIFEHDPEVAAATITKNDRGHFCVKEIIETE